MRVAAATIAAVLLLAVTGATALDADRFRARTGVSRAAVAARERELVDADLYSAVEADADADAEAEAVVVDCAVKCKGLTGKKRSTCLRQCEEANRKEAAAGGGAKPAAASSSSRRGRSPTPTRGRGRGRGRQTSPSRSPSSSPARSTSPAGGERGRSTSRTPRSGSSSRSRSPSRSPSPQQKPAAKSGGPTAPKSRADKKAARKERMKGNLEAKRAAADTPLKRDATAGGKHAEGSTAEEMVAHAKASKHKVNGQWQNGGLQHAIDKAKAEGKVIGTSAVEVQLEPGWGVVWSADGSSKPATFAVLMSKQEGGKYVVHGYPKA